MEEDGCAHDEWILKDVSACFDFLVIPVPLIEIM
jgi:hypothetical protein